jgi:hypothetical protein
MKKKITTELHQFKKLNQMCDFGVANRHHFAPDTPGGDALVAFTSTVNNLKDSTAAQASLENRLREQLRTKMEARLALREDVELLYHTAHAVAADKPGFDDKFQMSLWGDPKLLNAARSAVQDAATTAETFVKHAMPPDFLDALNGRVQRLERAREEYANGKTACSVGYKALEESLRKALAAGSGFDAIMRNTFRDDPITLEAWKTACRVPRTSRKKKEDAPDAGQQQTQTQSQVQTQSQAQAPPQSA